MGSRSRARARAQVSEAVSRAREPELAQRPSTLTWAAVIQGIEAAGVLLASVLAGVDAARGQLVTVRDPDCCTTVASVYAVGYCTGLGGAPAAEAEGVIAGSAVARSLGFAFAPGQARAVRRARARLARDHRFQAGLWSLFHAPRLLTELATPETVICRCEELTLADLSA